MSKIARQDQRRVTLRYRHDGISAQTSLTIDVEVPEDDMPHEHKQSLREMAEEVLGVPLGSLPSDVSVQLKRPTKHTHDHGDGHGPHSHDEQPITPKALRA